ncbi:MAG: ribosomal L7Ae/L30e/S12e/Gadd45 family protein [Ruminococcus sp.]|nr:ribosomal L7Ae/L30e/S12e/Gadd45 family protein [Ruminococcus sp.]
MNDRLLSFMGICRRAGKLVIGNDPVRESVETDKAFLVIMASDISQNTLKKIKPVIDESNVLCYRVNRTKDEISFSLGKACAIMSVTDKGFADKFEELIEAEQKKEETTI